MLIVLCVLVTCISLADQPGTDPNQVRQKAAAEVVTQNAPPADANVVVQTIEGSQVGEDTPGDAFHWWDAISWGIAALAMICGSVGGFLLAVHRYRKRIPETKEIETAKKQASLEFDHTVWQGERRSHEEDYTRLLADKCGWIRMMGSPDIPNLPVRLLDTFVSLRISDRRRSGEDPAMGRPARESDGDRDFTPEEIMSRAFRDRRMLVIIGDPGSGKTTLLNYYAMCCLSVDSWRRLGFSEAPLPTYYPLAGIQTRGQLPTSLAECLASWARDHQTPIPVETFDRWLRDRSTLILLDALDEIRDLDLRRAVCEWIDDAAAGLNKAKFVVTSRETGYRKKERVELGFPHLRADVREFSSEQKAEFLHKWFEAAFLEETRDDKTERQEWERRQKDHASQRAKEIIAFLDEPKNKAVSELAAVPMLLQIIAVIWKDREVLPHGRAELYEAALKYLLQYRDERKKLTPVLPAGTALRVLYPVALWMQEDLQAEEAEKGEFHKQVDAAIKTTSQAVAAEDFCVNLRERAGLIADYGDKAYIFRHKSFREYLAGRAYQRLHGPATSQTDRRAHRRRLVGRTAALLHGGSQR